jgi:Raf kinase inhibitor-like YbhB/YbcL family protein
MRQRWLAASLALALSAGIGLDAQGGQGGARPGGAAAPAAAALTLTSPAFQTGGKIPEKFGCSAQPVNVSPAFAWSDAPAGTQSLALVMTDLDYRPQRGVQPFLHWMVWNIPPSTRQLPEGVAAKSPLDDGAIQFLAKGRGGVIGYRSPCPPPGAPHHYVFTLFALDAKLDLPATATRDEVEQAMTGKVLGQGVLVGLFAR